MCTRFVPVVQEADLPTDRDEPIGNATHYLSAATGKASRVRRFASYEPMEESNETFALNDHIRTGREHSQFSDDFRLRRWRSLFRFLNQHLGFFASGSQTTDFALTFGTGHELLFVVVKTGVRKGKGG